VAGVFLAVGETVNRFVLTTFFSWLPDYFQVTAIFENPAFYPRSTRILIWLLALIFGSLLGPLVEEIYFRGLLLPMVYFVWWKKNIRIGIFSHCILNLVSDVILTIPLYFS
jgi:membrane protease YdiL (CAAX protease family)